MQHQQQNDDNGKALMYNVDGAGRNAISTTAAEKSVQPPTSKCVSESPWRPPQPRWLSHGRRNAPLSATEVATMAFRLPRSPALMSWWWKQQ